MSQRFLPESQPVPGLVWAFRIHLDGTADELEIEQPLDDRHDGWSWLHFNLADARACAFLKTLREIPPPAMAVLLRPDHHQQLYAEKACVYGVIADLSRSLDGVTEQVGYLHFVMTEHYLISGRRHALAAAEATRQALRKGYRLTSVASLLELIVVQIAETIDRLADEIAMQMDRIEERILDSETRDERQNLGIFRRTTVRLHRQLAGLQALFARLEHRGPSDLNPALRLETVRLSQRLDGLDQEIEALRARARILQEEVSHQVAEETNRNLRALSIVTILFLPPTLIAGFFGMNLKGLPFSGGDAGFWSGVAAAVASSIVVYAVLRWFGIASR